ncbi:MAG: exopolysaccharide biosynthesis polyprenyl glycosylphosphotransferase, partial [bacterium]|nr:exopolysaccharide biosynthesis polyprenyl glycosylphosphotransferase [bacterium]
MTASFLLTDLQISRSALTFSIFLIYFALQGNRFWLAILRRFLVKRGFLTVNVLIVGAGVSAIRLMHRMGAFPTMGYRVVGFVADGDGARRSLIDGVPVLGGRSEIGELIDRYDVEEVYIASSGLTPLKIIQLINELRGQKVEFKIVSNLIGVLAGGVNLEEVFDIPIIDVGRGGMGRAGRFVKGIIDKVFSIALMLALLPIWAMIYLGLKLESRGAPVLIRQRRIGRGGGEFNMYKFRTMYPTVPKYQMSPPSDDDIRVTPFGKILRKTALDETAQLINVLQGKMSLVGPRPDMPFIVAEYAPWQRFRLAVKPGITGLWQLAGRHDIPPHENIEFDFYYIQNQSILLDLVILMKTLPVLILGKAVY